MNSGQACLLLTGWSGGGGGAFFQPVVPREQCVYLVREGADAIIRPLGIGVASGCGLGRGPADPAVFSESSLKLVQRIQA